MRKIIWPTCPKSGCNHVSKGSCAALECYMWAISYSKCFDYLHNTHTVVDHSEFNVCPSLCMCTCHPYANDLARQGNILDQV